MDLKERIEKLNEFKNNALCRNFSNQNKAKKTLLELEKNPQDYLLLSVELSHYNMNEMTTEEFGRSLKNVIKQYEDYYDKLGTNSQSILSKRI